MKIFGLHMENTNMETTVFDSLEDFTKRIEWQDLLDNKLIILDESGYIYEWDKTKTEEYATTYNYTLIANKRNIELGQLCIQNYALNNCEDEFEFEYNNLNKSH